MMPPAIIKVGMDRQGNNLCSNGGTDTGGNLRRPGQGDSRWLTGRNSWIAKLRQYAHHFRAAYRLAQSPLRFSSELCFDAALSLAHFSDERCEEGGITGLVQGVYTEMAERVTFASFATSWSHEWLRGEEPLFLKTMLVRPVMRTDEQTGRKCPSNAFLLPRHFRVGGCFLSLCLVCFIVDNFLELVAIILSRREIRHKSFNGDEPRCGSQC